MFENTKKFFDRITSKFQLVFKRISFFIKDSKRKFDNLYQTNYNNGIYHLEHGNLWDATFRFKVIMRFWPDKVEPRYQYAICLVIMGDENKATEILNEILKKNPNYSKAKDLLAKIKNGEAKKIAADFKSKAEESKSVGTNTELNAKPKGKSRGNEKKRQK